jgi:hypothetical protein
MQQTNPWMNLSVPYALESGTYDPAQLLENLVSTKTDVADVFNRSPSNVNVKVPYQAEELEPIGITAYIKQDKKSDAKIPPTPPTAGRVIPRPKAQFTTKKVKEGLKTESPLAILSAEMAQDKMYSDILANLRENAEVQNHIRDMQKQELGKFQGMLAASVNPELDIRPVTKLLDKWGKSDITSTVQAPENIWEKVKAIRDVQDKVNQLELKNQEALAANDMLELKTELERENTKQKNEMLAQGLNLKMRGLDLEQQKMWLSAENQDKLPDLDTRTIESLSGLKQAIKSISDLEASIRNNKDHMGWIARAKTALPSGYGEKEKRLQSEILKNVQIIGRGLETRALTDADMVKYQRIIGDITNDPKTILTKIARLKSEIDWDLRQKVTAFAASRNVRGFSEYVAPKYVQPNPDALRKSTPTAKTTKSSSPGVAPGPVKSTGRSSTDELLDMLK